MLSRYELIDALGGVNSYEAVKEQLTHVLGMLILSHGDNLGIRTWAPFVMMRLDMDQECYNFIHWSLTNNEENEDNWQDWKKVGLTKPDGKDADVFEEIENLVTDASLYGGLATFAATALLKTKLFLDLCALRDQRDRSVLRRFNVPGNVPGLVKPFAPRSPIVKGNRQLMSGSDHTMSLFLLDSQVYQLYTCITMVNKHFWRILFDPGNALEDQPSSLCLGVRRLGLWLVFLIVLGLRHLVLLSISSIRVRVEIGHCLLRLRLHFAGDSR